jgi:hypothetical protein
MKEMNEGEIYGHLKIELQRQNGPFGILCAVM